MLIWIDGQCFQTSSRLRGIGRYVEGLIRGISDGFPEVELAISFNAAMLDAGIAARDHIRRWVKPKNIHVWQGVAEGGEALLGYTPKRRLSEIAIAHHVATLRPDIALSASPFEGSHDLAVPLLPDPQFEIPVASIFFDAIPHRFPQQYIISNIQHDYYYRRLESLKNSEINLCISEFVKRESIDIFPSVKCLNIDAGISSEIEEILASMETVPENEIGDFVLYVGGMDWRKNISLIINAIGEIRGKVSTTISFVIAGDGPSSARQELKSLWLAAGLPRTQLKILGYVTDRELVSLYRNASVVVQPSFMEGFGLSVLEAMRCGAPVIGAAAGAIPEVIGDDALLFDPNDVGSLCRLLSLILGDKCFRQRIAAQGRDRAERFTWKRTATLAVEHLASHRDEMARVPIGRRREKIAADVRAIDVPLNVAAKTLAIAETLNSQTRRLIIEATATSIEDHGSGIQRVVKSMCSQILKKGSAGGLERIVVFGDDLEGFFQTGVDVHGKFQKAQKNDYSKIIFGNQDTLVLLDSSWEYHNIYAETLMHARIKGTEIASCLYDTVPLRNSAFCHSGMPPMFAAWFKSALKYSTSFVCISQAVADELYNLLRAIEFPRPMKIGYWHLGADFRAAPDAIPQLSKQQKSPSFLMVGTLEPRKGYGVVLDAFDELWKNGFDAQLAIVGKLGWGSDHIADRIQKHPERNSRLHWYGAVSDAELQNLYAECDVLIAASFAEGFGLPIVEARRFGKPIIASDIPVFREVAKDASTSRFFEVGSASALAETVQETAEELSSGVMANGTGTHWLSWAESASQFESVVLGGNWYRVYEPVEERSFASILDIGRTSMMHALAPPERAHSLELLEGPIPAQGGKLRFLVRVANLSNRTWSSTGADGVGGVNLGYRVLKADGAPLPDDNARSAIPFVMIPGDSHCMAIEVPAALRRKGGALLNLEMVQGAAEWWGNPLRVGL